MIPRALRRAQRVALEQAHRRQLSLRPTAPDGTVAVLVDRYERRPPCADPWEYEVRRWEPLALVTGWELRLPTGELIVDEAEP